MFLKLVQACSISKHTLLVRPQIRTACSIFKNYLLRLKCADSMDPITFSILEFVMSGPFE